jgi:DNA-binding transcriptional MerR regulator
MSNDQDDNPVERQSKRARKRPGGDGWLSSELSALVGMRPRTIAEYCQRGLITKPVFRGRSTRYPREVFVRLLAIKLWRLDHGALGIDDLRARLARRTPQELEQWVLSRAFSAAVRAALTPLADEGAGGAIVPTSERDARSTTLSSARGASGVHEVNATRDGGGVSSGGGGEKRQFRERDGDDARVAFRTVAHWFTSRRQARRGACRAQGFRSLAARIRGVARSAR